MNFGTAFDRLMGNEGGYVNNPADPGGETQWGISRRAYPDVDIAALTRDQAKVIYQRDFWLRGQMDKMPPAIAFQAFDVAVNSGIETAIRMLQRAVDVAEDGHVGPVTLAAVAAKPLTDVLMRFVAERLDFYAKLKTFDTFGRGWTRRCAKDLRFAAQDA